MKAQAAVRAWNENKVGGKSLFCYLSEVGKEVNTSALWVEYHFEDSVVRIYNDGSKSYWLNPL